jgi:hypothetical protein
MGRNVVAGGQQESLRQWEASATFRAETKIIRKRGRPKGSTPNIDWTDDPRTPFEALRILMKISRKEWQERLGCSQSFISQLERGELVATVGMAKLMQEEARKEGINVTLDELYQHVIPWQVEPSSST